MLTETSYVRIARFRKEPGVIYSITHRKYMSCALANELQYDWLLKSSRRTRMTEMDRHDWKQLAEAARDEEDPRKLIDLIQQLNRALDEHMKNQYPFTTEAAS
jgi:hypothetical protein